MRTLPIEQPPADTSPPSTTPPLSGNDLLLWSALPDLTLNIAQTAALCGVSVRQLGYWTKQGYVTATGKGARRLFGPEALRRILAIRQSMHNGLSLRQALRSLEGGSNGTQPHPGPQGLSEDLPRPAVVLPLADTEVVVAEILTLFSHNRETRDSIGGLSTKLGRAEVDVRQAVERLSSRGTLRKSFAGSEMIFALEGHA